MKLSTVDGITADKILTAGFRSLIEADLEGLRCGGETNTVKLLAGVAIASIAPFLDPRQPTRSVLQLGKRNEFTIRPLTPLVLAAFPTERRTLIVDRIQPELVKLGRAVFEGSQDRLMLNDADNLAYAVAEHNATLGTLNAQARRDAKLLRADCLEARGNEHGAMIMRAEIHSEALIARHAEEAWRATGEPTWLPGRRLTREPNWNVYFE